MRRAGRSVLVLEAGARVGAGPGRCGRLHLAARISTWARSGLHSAEINPLTPIARAAGETMLDADAIRHRRMFVGGKPASAAELAEYETAWDRYEAEADRLLATGQPDVPLARVAENLAATDPWAVTVETWEGPIICVADAASFSLRDWRNNVLEGGNILLGGGLGDFVRRRLTPSQGLHLETPVTAIRWQEQGGVAVETPRGTVAARAAIVTVSTGVLAAGAIRFDPALPPAVQNSVAALPMGLALKVVLRAACKDRLDLPPFTSVARRFERSGEPAVVFSAWPWEQDHVIAWIGAATAWELTRSGPAAADDFVRAELRSLFGSRVDSAFLPGPALLSEWGTDPLFRGAYSYARPGHAGARATLGEPLAGGRLVFAGEATHTTLAGTVGGAWETGQRAAVAVLAGIEA